MIAVVDDHETNKSVHKLHHENVSNLDRPVALLGSSTRYPGFYGTSSL